MSVRPCWAIVTSGRTGTDDTMWMTMSATLRAGRSRCHCTRPSSTLEVLTERYEYLDWGASNFMEVLVCGEGIIGNYNSIKDERPDKLGRCLAWRSGEAGGGEEAEAVVAD